MRWRFAFALALAWWLAWEGAMAGEIDLALDEARAALVESIRDYRLSLERLIALQEGAAARAEDQARVRQRLLERGVVSRREAADSERAAAAARGIAEETRRKLSEADAAFAETLTALEDARNAAGRAIARPPAVLLEPDAPEPRPDATAPVVARLEHFFRVRFARSLPVSARGQTALHDRLRLDHHHAVDVSVHPDSEEGRALVDYLTRHQIPFLVFRGSVSGASTGAHVHVGRASSRVTRSAIDGR